MGRSLVLALPGHGRVGAGPPPEITVSGTGTRPVVFSVARAWLGPGSCSEQVQVERGSEPASEPNPGPRPSHFS